jgi:uncharacterized protein YndB with AHSA1/START domain
VTECDLPDAPQKVWKALTVPELLAGWLPEAVDCEILAAEPNRLLRYRWTGKEEDGDEAGRTLESVVTFELTGTEAGGTHLRVVHRLVPDAVAFAGADMSSNILAFKRRWKEPFVMGNLRAGSPLVPLASALRARSEPEPCVRWAA